MTCAISWGHCSLIGLLVVMSVVVVLVLLLFSAPVDGGGGMTSFKLFEYIRNTVLRCTGLNSKTQL